MHLHSSEHLLTFCVWHRAGWRAAKPVSYLLELTDCSSWAHLLLHLLEEPCGWSAYPWNVGRSRDKCTHWLLTHSLSDSPLHSQPLSIAWTFDGGWTIVECKSISLKDTWSPNYPQDRATCQSRFLNCCCKKGILYPTPPPTLATTASSVLTNKNRTSAFQASH